MKRTLIAVTALASSLALAACGATATLNQAIASVGSSPDLQMDITASASGAGMAQAQQILSDLSLKADFSNPTGAALSQTGASANCELVLDAGGQSLLDVLEVDSNVYAEVNVSTLATVPTVNLSAGEVAALQLMLGGRWFELPESLINTHLPSGTGAVSAARQDEALGETIFNDLSAFVASKPYTTLPGGGYAQTGSLESVAQTLFSAIESVSGAAASIEVPATVPQVAGTYRISVSTSGSTATAASVSITAPNSTQGDATISIDASITHELSGIVAPSNPIVITPSLLNELESQLS